MRILTLSKRRRPGKDPITDRFGRLYELPEALAARGHAVRGLLLGYRREREGEFAPAGPAGVQWRAINAGLHAPAGLLRYRAALAELVGEFRPELIWAGSDALHALIGRHCSRRHGIPLVIDLYDNFAAFGASRLPGVTPLLHAACRAAAGLTVVSRTLQRTVTEQWGVRRPCLVLGNAVPHDRFRPLPRDSARAALGLPAGARLVGTAGAIDRAHGSAALFQAFAALAADDPDLHLVFAGPRDATPARYPHPRALDFGLLPPARMPEFWSALDVAVICNADNEFGRCCFPQKFHEIVACRTPLVAARVGDVAELLGARPDCLYAPGSAADLGARLRDQLAHATPVTHLRAPEWSELAVRLEPFLERCATARSA